VIPRLVCGGGATAILVPARAREDAPGATQPGS
jgi:hypothetical protein